jgi:hypothetical protein
MRDAKKLNHAFLNYQKDHQEYKQKYRWIKKKKLKIKKQSIIIIGKQILSNLI